MSEFVQRRQDGVSAHQAVEEVRGRAGHPLNERRLPERTLQIFFQKKQKTLDIFLHIGYFIVSKTFYENVKQIWRVMV